MVRERLSKVGLSGVWLGAAVARGQVVIDPGFEAGSPSAAWAEYSTNYGTPLCNGACLPPGSPTIAHSGAWWAWFGGAPDHYEHATLAQTMFIPPGGAILHFFLLAYSTRLDGQDSLRVFVDATPVFGVTDLQLGPYLADYVQVDVDLSAFVGGTRTLKFECVQTGTSGLYTNFHVDDVTIESTAFPPAPCYPNCDGSSVQPCLNVLDFSCFLNKFAAGDTYANCDLSTSAPALNVLDFACFLNRFAAGCSHC